MASNITRVSTTSDGQQADGDSSIEGTYSYEDGALGPNAFSADGSEIVFVTNAGNITGGPRELVLKDLTSGKDTVVTAADSASFTPDGHHLVYTAFDNGAEQVFEQTGGKTVLVSSAGDGTEGDGYSSVLAVTADGGRVAFDSSAGNLVAGQDPNVTSFVKDVPTGKIVQLGDGNTSTASSTGFSYAADLSEAVYTDEPDDPDTGPAPEVYAENLTDGSKTLVSGVGATLGDKGGFGGILLAGGKQVVFNSLSTNLVAGAPSGGIFVKNLSTGALSAVLANKIVKTSTETSGTAYQAVAGSPDGSDVAYLSTTADVTTNPADGSTRGTYATQIVVRNLATGREADVTPMATATFSEGPLTSPGASYESPFDNGGTHDTSAVNGTAYTGTTYSPDGTKIAYASETYTNYMQDDSTTPPTASGTLTSQIFVYNVATGTTTAVSDPATFNAGTKNGEFFTAFDFSPNSQAIKIGHDTYSQSAQGSTSALTSSSETIVTNLATGTRTVVPAQNSDALFAPDGKSIVFSSTNPNLVPGDTNNASDVFKQSVAQCFATGTSIRTARGDIAVEALRVGDLAETMSGALRPVVWIGHRVVACRAGAISSESWPVRVRAGAFGGELPERDLMLSQGHPVLVGEGADEVLVPIMCLINGTSIARVPVETVTYWHVELDAHDILLAEGLPAESFLDLGSRGWFETAADDALANPDLVAPGRNGRCRPVAIDGPVVDAERRRLDAVFAMHLAAPCAWPAEDVSVLWH